MPAKHRFARLLLVVIALVLAAAVYWLWRSSSFGGVVPGARSRAGSLRGRDVVLIVADSMAAAHTSLHGYSRPTTPGLAALARRGVTFDSASSQTSWTLSSMVTLFTGLAQEVHGVLRAEERLDDSRWRLAATLKQRGYRTAAYIQNGVIRRETGLDIGFDTFEVRPASEDFERCLTDLEAELKRDDGAPRFFYVHLLPPHMPYTPGEPYESRFNRETGAPEVEGSIVDVAIAMRDRLGPETAFTRRLVDLYDAHINYADALVTRIVQAVEAGRGLTNTCLVVTADHGEAFMQHGATGHNLHVYQEMVHVPLIIVAEGASLPWLQPGSRFEPPVAHFDVAPTICHLLDIPGPPRADGRAVFSRANASVLQERTLAFSSRYPRLEAPQNMQRAVRQGHWKLIVNERTEGTSHALYDLVADPGEQRDVAEQHPDRVAALVTALEQTLDSQRARASIAQRLELDAGARDMLRSLGYADYIGGPR